MNSHISIQSLFSLQVPSVKTKAHALLRVTTTSNQQDAKMLLFPNHALPPLYYYQGTNALSNLPYMSSGNKVRTASSNRGLCWWSNLSTASHTQEKMERARTAHRGEDQNDPEYRALLFTVQLATPAIWEPRPVHETAASHPCALPESWQPYFSSNQWFAQGSGHTGMASWNLQQATITICTPRREANIPSTAKLPGAPACRQFHRRVFSSASAAERTTVTPVWRSKCRRQSKKTEQDVYAWMVRQGLSNISRKIRVLQYFPVTDEDIILFRHLCYTKVGGFIKIKSGHKRL